MSASRTGLLACPILILALAFAANAQIPVGLDAYRMWDRWPYQRIGVRAYMRSTYDRAGGNERADASHFLFPHGVLAHVLRHGLLHLSPVREGHQAHTPRSAE